MTNDLVVLIPGIGGSRLERDGKPIYDLSLGALPRLLWNWAGDGLVFQGGSARPDDGVVATALFSNQLIPGFFGIDDYDGLCATLMSVLRYPEQQFHRFPYDWRASNRWAAESLDAFIRPKLHHWRRGQGGKDAKLWLICHSMGGLVARYFLECLGGKEVTRHLVTIATPHRGAPKALGALVNGLGLGPLDFSKVVRSFASTYELLPQYPVVHVGDGSDAPLARVEDLVAAPASALSTGHRPETVVSCPTLPFVDPDLFDSAKQFHAAIRQSVAHRAEEDVPEPYAISCLFNRRQPTAQSARWAESVLTLSNRLPQLNESSGDLTFQQGDGSVPGASAVPIEWDSTASALQVDQKHVAMPSSSLVTDLIYNLANPLDVRKVMDGGSRLGSIGLAVPPMVSVGCSFEIEIDVVQAATLTLSATLFGARRPSISETVQVEARSSRRVKIMLREPGSYLVTARSVDPSRPRTSDWLVAIDAN